MQSVVTGQAPTTLEWKITPGGVRVPILSSFLLLVPGTYPWDWRTYFSSWYRWDCGEDSAISAPSTGTLGTGEDSVISGPGTLGTRQAPVISAPGNLGAGDN